MPVYALFENLASGAMIDEFVEWSPGIDRESGLDGAETWGKGVGGVEAAVRSGRAGFAS